MLKKSLSVLIALIMSFTLFTTSFADVVDWDDYTDPNVSSTGTEELEEESSETKENTDDTYTTTAVAYETVTEMAKGTITYMDRKSSWTETALNGDTLTIAEHKNGNINHKFIKWCTDSDGTDGEDYYEGDTVNVQEHITLYAIYESAGVTTATVILTALVIILAVVIVVLLITKKKNKVKETSPEK